MKDLPLGNPKGGFAPPAAGEERHASPDANRADTLIGMLTDYLCDHVTESLEAVGGAIERRIILRVLGKTGGNQTEAARLLGIKRTTLNYKLKKLKIGVRRGRLFLAS